MRLSVVVFLTFALPLVSSVSEECTALVPELLEKCSVFDFASDRVLDFEADAAQRTAEQDNSTLPTLSDTLNRISEAAFDASCCDLITRVNDSKCFCESDVVASLMSETSDELLAFAIFSAARPIDDGCGGMIWTSLDEGPCLLLGPEPDYVAGDEACRPLEDELSNPRRVNGRFALLEEALDLTGVLDEVLRLRQFVLFAPTDTAFRNFAEEQNVTVNDLLADTDLLKDVLRRHVVTGNEIRNLRKRRSETETLQGTTVTVRRTKAGRFTVQGFPIIQEDVQLCRGRVNVINGVLWPPTERNREPKRETSETVQPKCDNIYELLLSFEEAFSSLLKQINAFSDIKDLLEGPENFTFFASTSNEVPESELGAAREAGESRRKQLERLIVRGDISASELVSGATLRSVSGESLIVSVENGVVRISGVRILQADIVACNGRVHIVGVPLPEIEAIAEQDQAISEADPARVRSPTDRKTRGKEKAKEEESAAAESKGTCTCSENGLSNGIDTGTPGCMQHRLSSGNSTLFCYVEDSNDCAEETYEVFESETTPGAYWRRCTRDEAELASTADTLQENEFLKHIHKYFVFSRLENVLDDDASITILVPEMSLFNRYNIDSLLELGEEGVKHVRKLLRRHILPGTFTSETFGSLSKVSALDGTVVSLGKDASKAIVLDNSVRFTRQDILTDTAVIHVVDGFIQPHRINKQKGSDPCECVQEEDEEIKVPLRRRGCKQHIANEAAFCYVKEPDSCLIATQSNALSETKWRVCMDPCRCSETGLSGAVSTGRRGCARHLPGDPPFCYIAEPERCNQGTLSIGFPGATWKWCGRPEALGTVQRMTTIDPCDCTQDGFSGGSYTGRSGCGAFNFPFPFIDVCYVLNPSSCNSAVPSIRFTGAAWRFC